MGVSPHTETLVNLQTYLLSLFLLGLAAYASHMKTNFISSSSHLSYSTAKTATFEQQTLHRKLSMTCPVYKALNKVIIDYS